MTKERAHMECYYENEQIRFCGGGEIQDAVFVGFPSLTFEGTRLKSCTFKDCREVFFHGSTVEECNFENVSLAYAQYTKITGCAFDTCCANGTLLTLEAEGEIEDCIFRHITVLGEDGNIIHFVYGDKSKVRPLKNCRFEDCEVESGKPILCEYLTTMEIYKPQETDCVDHSTCIFC